MPKKASFRNLLLTLLAIAVIVCTSVASIWIWLSPTRAASPVSSQHKSPFVGRWLNPNTRPGVTHIHEFRDDGTMADIEVDIATGAVLGENLVYWTYDGESLVLSERDPGFLVKIRDKLLGASGGEDRLRVISMDENELVLGEPDDPLVLTRLNAHREPLDKD